jgi:PAS domain S-box-containing protein
MAIILVVDDERGMRITLQRFLEAEGHTVLTAVDSLEALGHLAQSTPDVVISDIIMPRIGGMDLLKTLTADHPDTKVIMITGEPTVDTASESFRTGAFDYLSKPFNRATILRTVDRALQMRDLELENRRYKENLEKMVEERTAELLDTNRRLEQEIAERHQAVEALKRSEARSREIAELLPEIVFEMDDTGRLTFVNKQAFEKTGYTQEEFLSGFNGFDLLVQSDRSRVSENMARYLSGEQVVPHEYMARRKDGSTFPIVARSTAIIVDGKPIGLRGILLDISARKQFEDKLLRAEREKSIILDAMHEGVMFLNPELDVIWANQAAAKALNIAMDKLIGTKCSDLWDSPSESCKLCSTKKAMQTGQPQTRETQYPDNTIWKVDSYPVFDDDNKLLGVVDIRENITDRKFAEQALKESEVRFRSIVQSSPVGIHLYRYKPESDDAILVDANEASEKILGIPCRQHIGKALQDAFPVLANTGAALRFREAARHGTSWHATLSYSEKKNAKGNFDVYAFQTSPDNMAAMFLDITERVEWETALKESEEKYRTLFETMAEGVIYLEMDGSISTANPSAERILGVPLAEMLGLTSEDKRWVVMDESGNVVSADKLPAVVSLRTGKPATAIFGVHNPSDQTLHWLNVHSVPQFLNGADKPHRAYATFADITDQKLADFKLREYQKRLRALASDLTVTEENERQKIARELHDNIGQLLALAKIKLGLLMKSISDTSHASQAEEVFELITRMVQHVQQLTFELSSLQIYDGDWQAAIEDLVRELFEPDVHPVTIHARGLDTPIDTGARTILYRSVRELFYNILKHAGPCAVELHILREPGTIEVVVKDDGKGFDSEELDIFPIGDRHFGLFSVKERIEFAGGVYKLETAPGKGVCVTLSLPLGEDLILDQTTRGKNNT